MSLNRWYPSQDQLENSPSRKCGVTRVQELRFRQLAANLIQTTGGNLKINQLGINTAIVYMHRFYLYHSFTKFHQNEVAIAALFLAAKTEEQPRKLDLVIEVAIVAIYDKKPLPNNLPQKRWEMKESVLFNENVLLQTLGFDIAIEHPHPHIVKCCQLVRASKELYGAAYFMASNSLHLTTMCLQYKPSVVACFCIFIICKWANLEIPPSKEGKLWFWYIDQSVTQELLEKMIDAFCDVFDNYSSKLKRTICDIYKTSDLSGFIFGDVFNKKDKDSELPTFLAQPIQAKPSNSYENGAASLATSREEEQKRRIDATLGSPLLNRRNSHEKLSERNSGNSNMKSSRSTNDHQGPNSAHGVLTQPNKKLGIDKKTASNVTQVPNEKVSKSHTSTQMKQHKSSKAHKKSKKKEHRSKKDFEPDRATTSKEIVTQSIPETMAPETTNIPKQSENESEEKPLNVKIKLIRISPNVPENSDVTSAASSTGARKRDCSGQGLPGTSKALRGQRNSSGYNQRRSEALPQLMYNGYIVILGLQI